jgi:hypothetical protein
LKTYDPREIRRILKDMQYTEIIPPEHAEHNILYFQKDDVLVELKMDEEYLPLQIEVLCERIGLTKDEFEDRYKKAKKHKI